MNDPDKDGRKETSAINDDLSVLQLDDEEKPEKNIVDFRNQNSETVGDTQRVKHTTYSAVVSGIDPGPGLITTTNNVTADNTEPSDEKSPSRPQPADQQWISPELEAASQFLSPEELEQINQALKEADEEEEQNHTQTQRETVIQGSTSEHKSDNDNNTSAPAVASVTCGSEKLAFVGISEDEAAAIERAIAEADALEEAKSEQLARRMYEEEERWRQQQLERTVPIRSSKQGNVRTMTRAELKAEEAANRNAYMASPRNFGEQYAIEHETVITRDDEHGDEFDGDVGLAAGFRMNSATLHSWSRLDQHSIVGPNNEVRTKHDAALDSQANIHRLGIEDEGFTSVGNRTFNSFRQSMKRKTKKGVDAHGTGRAGSDADGTKGGALDTASFEQITRAINSGWFNKLNGVVKEGKEAVIYHADKGAESNDMDVAVKLFKRIQEFRNRGEYVDGDPRFNGISFKNTSKRQQLALWTEKEFRNLTRANRAGVPVPTPLMYKENMLCMRFMGLEGWPAPQLRELDLRKGSKKWEILYNQVMGAIRSLYLGADLVHGDLSEYNIMVAPAHLVDNVDEAIENPNQEVQAVLIDFGQAVGIRHPSGDHLLKRDLDRVTTFFARQGIHTMTAEEAFRFTTESE